MGSQPVVPTYAAATPCVLTSVSQMSEDYLLTSDVLADGAADIPIAVFSNSAGLSEVLAIDNSGNLNHVFRDANSDSGWNTAPAVSSCSASAVVAGTDLQGVINAFYIGANDEVY